MHSVAAVAEENGGVLSALGPDGVAVFPADDPHTPVWRRLAGARRTWCFGWDASAEVWPQHSRWLADHWEIQLHTPVGVVGTELHIAGRHNLRNAMAAAACTLSGIGSSGSTAPTLAGPLPNTALTITACFPSRMPSSA